MTPLMYAADEGRTDCVRLLLDVGADKDAKDLVRAAGPAMSAVGLCFLDSCTAQIAVLHTISFPRS
jgi:ankyrin repeat protein